MRSNVNYLKGLCLVLIVALVVGMGSLSCQSVRGIYYKGEDFDRNIMKLKKTSDKKCKLYFPERKTFLKVKYGDSTFVFRKDSVFGYQDNDGYNFRFFKGEVYLVLNQGEKILLYKTERNGGTTKYPRIVVSYFFSKDSSSPLFSLTQRNLMFSFNENKKFTELLEIHFRDDSELMEFDSTYNMYKINRLLQLSNNHE